jgi:hypothetical protein
MAAHSSAARATVAAGGRVLVLALATWGFFSVIWFLTHPD